MAEFLSKAAILQAAFVIGFIKDVINRLACGDCLIVFDSAGFGKRGAVHPNKPCDVGTKVSELCIKLQFLVQLGRE